MFQRRGYSVVLKSSHLADTLRLEHFESFLNRFYFLEGGLGGEWRYNGKVGDMNETVFLETFGSYAKSIIPWFFLGSVVSFWVEKWIRPRVIRRYLGSLNYGKMLVLQLLGMVSPISIMTSLPVAEELVNLGGSPGLILGFLAAERAYDLQSIFIISHLFGLRFAILNVLAIFLALSLASLAVMRDKFTVTSHSAKVPPSFVGSQLRLFGLMLVGILVGAGLRTIVPVGMFRDLTKSSLTGMLVAVFMGLLLYFGTILGNYPVGKAFLELGMSKAGVFAFLTVSPLFNIVVILLFLSVGGVRSCLKLFGVYTAAAILLSLFAAPVL